jgi:hypothetical protein
VTTTTATLPVCLTPHPAYAGVLCTDPVEHDGTLHRNVNMPAEQWDVTLTPYVAFDADSWGGRRHYLATDTGHAAALYVQDAHQQGRDTTFESIRPATIDDAPWTIARCSPTDEPDWWQMDDPCDYDTGGCHHPVHAFGAPTPLRHLIDAPGARLAAKFGWWS